MKQLFHTPEGVRDVYGTECEKKLYLQEKLQKVYETVKAENESKSESLHDQKHHLGLL